MGENEANAGPSGYKPSDKTDSKVDNTQTKLEIAKISEGWDFVKSFMANLKLREQQNDNVEVQDFICKVNKEMKSYITDEKKIEVKEENKEDSLSTSSDSETETSEYGSSSGSEEEYHPKKKKSKKKPEELTDESKFKMLLDRLDNRVMPELEPFDEESCESLVNFIKNFEEHYKNNFKGNKQFRVRALEKLFTGRILESYKAIRKVEREYSIIKKRLLSWYEGEKEMRKQKAKRKFEKATVKKDESMLMYSNRLMSLFRLAYPNKKAEKSDNLN